MNLVAWAFKHLVTHTVILMLLGGGGSCPIKIKPASILASIQSWEAQWTQAPDRDTDTLPRITGHGPCTLHAQSLCCFSNFRLVSPPSSPLRSDRSVCLWLIVRIPKKKTQITPHTVNMSMLESFLTYIKVPTPQSRNTAKYYKF